VKLENKEVYQLMKCVFCGFTKTGVGQSLDPVTVVVAICESCFVTTTPEAKCNEMAKAVTAAGFEGDPSKPVTVNIISRPLMEV